MDLIPAPDSSERLFALMYEELRRLARRHLSADGPQTLQPTALVHEAYLRIMGDAGAVWDNPGHFFASAANAMRRILVDRARARNADRRGGGWRRLPEGNIEAALCSEEPGAVLAIDEALAALQAIDPRKVQIVSLRYFAGLSIEQTAAAMGLSCTTVKHEWQFARAWLYAQLQRELNG
jgi:RNA polymerase sigma factor (TIGR02999 family)